jgi:hypothetical protein
VFCGKLMGRQQVKTMIFTLSALNFDSATVPTSNSQLKMSIFQQDNARPHIARKTVEFLKDAGGI